MSLDPIARFRRWFREAQKMRIAQPEAMALATVSPGGAPSVRYVLLKEVTADGFVFFTDKRSRKGKDLAKNSRVAATFYWGALGRQVRIEGTVRPVAPRQADTYWTSRPRGSQLSAAASFQSAEVDGRRALVSKRQELANRYRGKPVPRPPSWGGYRIVPRRIEFWLHRDDRLHHRELFVRTPAGWKKMLLMP